MREKKNFSLENVLATPREKVVRKAKQKKVFRVWREVQGHGQSDRLHVTSFVASRPSFFIYAPNKALPCLYSMFIVKYSSCCPCQPQGQALRTWCEGPWLGDIKLGGG